MIRRLWDWLTGTDWVDEADPVEEPGDPVDEDDGLDDCLYEED